MNTKRILTVLLIPLASLAILALLLLGAQASSAAAGAQQFASDYQPPRPSQADGAELDAFVVLTDVVGLEFPNNNCAQSYSRTLEAPDVLIQDLNVGIVVTHDRRSDVRLWVESPSGVTVMLTDNTGGNYANFDVMLDSESANLPGEPAGDHDPAVPHYENVWQPVGDLSSLYGESAHGTWRLWYCDASNEPNGHGTLDIWSLWFDAQEADLEIVKSGEPNPVTAGQVLTYTLQVSNYGTLTATEVVITDYLPISTTFLGVLPVDTICSAPGSNPVVCQIESLPPEASATFQLLVGLDNGLPEGEISNYVNVSSQTGEINYVNNEFWAANYVLIEPDDDVIVTAITPSYGYDHEDTPVSISGFNFKEPLVVSLGQYELQSTVVVSEELIQALVPAGLPLGVYDLTVYVSEDNSATLPGAFTVLKAAAPVLNAVTPPKGLNITPVDVAIDGENFSPAMEASLSDAITTEIELESLAYISPTRMTAIVPAGIPSGTYTLTVADLNTGQSASLADAYQAYDMYDDLTAYEFDLWTTPPSLQTQQPVTVGLTVRRIGGELPFTVDVDFYAGDQFIGKGVIDGFEPSSSEVVAVPWLTPATTGEYVLRAVINPLRSLPEDDYTNNEVARLVEVMPYDPPAVTTTIESFLINNGAEFVDGLGVQLDTVASGDPASLYFIEYLFNQALNAWMPIAESGWLPYTEASAAYPWELSHYPGVHYLQVRVADHYGNIAAESAMARVNYLPLESHIAELEIHMYRMDLQAGDVVLARLTSVVGDADLYAWGPDGSDLGRSETVDPLEEVTFTALVDGTYQVEVEGYTSADYRLVILRSDQEITVEQLDSLDLDHVIHPDVRGRSRPLDVDLPGDTIGLPSAPVLIFNRILPLVRK